MTKLRFLCLLIASCLLFGCKPNSSKTKPDTNVTDPTSGSTDVKPEPPKTEPPKPEPPKEDPPKPAAPISKLCGDANFDLNASTNEIAKNLSGIMYDTNAATKADCSGIFHRVLGKFKDICPDAKLPVFEKARDSRSLAAWYKENGDLKIVRTPATEADLIQPGTVMFYGYGKRRNQYDFQKMNMDTLSLYGTGINHVAIVTSVNRVDGDLISYELFHGRSPGKESDITTSQKVPSSRSIKDLPMYGNWDEPWLAVASPFGI